MRAAGVDQAVLVHSAAIYADDTSYTLESADQHPACSSLELTLPVQPPATRLADLWRSATSMASDSTAAMDKQPPRGLMHPKPLPLWAEAARQEILVALPTARELEDVPALRRVLERLPAVRVALRQRNPLGRCWTAKSSSPTSLAMQTLPCNSA
jgi:hypothetical protein